jgi:hypothetical protein
MPAQFSNPDPASASPPSTPFDSILAQCRDLVCERLSQALSGMLDKVDEVLTASINESRDANAKKLYAKTRDKTLAQRQSIEKQFSTRYLREFQRRSNRVKKIGDSFAEIDLSSLTLELVGEEDLEETLKFNALAARLRQYCDEELIALDQRVGVLLGDAGLQAEDNPFTPQAICDAYKDTCRQLDPDVEVRMVLLKLFDDHVADAIRAVYKAVNALLVQNSILPKIRISARKEPSSRQPTPGAAASEAPKALAQPEPKAAEGEQDLFAILKNLRANNLNAMPQAGSIPGAGAPVAGVVGAGAGTAGSGPVIQGSELLGLLTRIQLGDAGAVAGTVLPVAAPGVDPGMANILRELKSSSVGSGMNQLDMMTLDIMSLVFDQLFDDPKIPVGAKGLIGRLQIPMLKVAIADKTFFSKKGHPARQLLDTLGEISLRLPPDFNASSPLFKRMEVILQRLIDGFADKMEIFDVARGELETLLNEENQRAEQEALSAAKQIEQKERLALAKTIAQAEIRARARTAKVPLPVLEFLIQQWVQVLLIVHVVDGEDSAAWKTALETMDLLIWSVEPKPTAEERHELKAIVPELLQGLVAGLKLVGAEEAIRSGFFTDLKNLHDEILGDGGTEDTIELHGTDEAATAPAAVTTRPAAPTDLEFAPAASAEPAITPSEEPAAASFAQAPASGARPAAAAAELAPANAVAAPATVAGKETVPAAARSSLMPDVDFGASATEPIPAPAEQAVPDATPALIPDLNFDFAGAPVSESAAIPLVEPLLPGVEASPAPVAEKASSLDLEFRAEKSTVTPAPEPVPERAAGPAFLPDLEFESLPVPSSTPVPTVAPPSVPAAEPPAKAAEPVFVLELDFAPTPPASAPPATSAEFVSLPEPQSRPEKAAEPTGLPDLNFAMPETSPAPVAKSDAARPASAPSAKASAAPAARAAPSPGQQPVTAPAANSASPPAAQRAAPPDAPPASPSKPAPMAQRPPAPGQPASAGTRPAASAGIQPVTASAQRPAQSQRSPATGGHAPAPGARPAGAPASRPATVAQKTAPAPGAAPGARAATTARPAVPGQAPGQGVRPGPAAPGAAQRSASSLDFTAPVTVKNPFGGGKVEVEDLDFTVKAAAGPAGAKSEATVAELPANLKVGTWVGIRGKNDKEPRKSAKLSFISPLKTRFLFVDKQGKTTLDCSRADLARRFHGGEVVFMDKVPEVPLFDRLTEGLVGKLGGSKPGKT